LKRRIVILLLIIIVAKSAIAQSFFNSSLYIENKHSINPAYAGLYKHPHLFLFYRKIATSFVGVPESYGLGISSTIYKNMSLGGRFYKQSEGLFNTIVGFIDYSYELKLNDKQNLRFGISGGLNSNKIDYSEIVADNPSAIIDVASKSFEGTYFESAAGIVYNFEELEVSLSIPKLFESKKNYTLSLNTFFQYNYNINKTEIDLKPSLLVSYNQKGPTLFDINLQAFWNNKFWVGAGYKNRPGIILSAGLSFDRFGISYAAELGTEKHANMFNQIHEIGVSYSFSKKRSVPNDTLITPPNNLYVKNDSVETTNQINIEPIVIENVSPEETDILFADEEQNSEHEAFELEEDISIIEPLTLDILDNYETNFNEITEDSEQDSLLAEDNYELIEIGNGVFTVTQKKENPDSINFEEDINEAMLDSLINESKLFEQQENGEENNTDGAYHHSEYYTVQLFINDSNKSLLTNAKIVDRARIERTKDNVVKYYYGYFSSKTEAERHQKRLSKFNLETQVLKFNSYE